MKASPYIAWAKSRYGVRYNLARSGVPACPLDRLEPTLEDLLATGLHEDGWAPLVERIAARYEVAAEQVVLTHGASMANHLACAALLEPGDPVLVERPAYEPLRLLPEYLHASVGRFDRPAAHGYRPDLDEIRDRLTPRTRLVLLSDLHNPAGARLDDRTLDSLSALAEAHGFHVLVDEVYLELLHPRGARTAATRSRHFVTTRSLTKAYGLDSLRIGWILAEPALAERMRRLNDLFSVKTAHPSERLAALALDRADRLLAPVLALLGRNLEIVDAFVAAQPRLSWMRPVTGSVGLVRLIDGSVDGLVERLESAFDATVAPGRFFDAPDCFRIGWGMETPLLEAGLERLARGLATA